RRRAGDLVEDAEAVDDDDRGLEAVEVLGDRGGGLVEPAGAGDAAEVDEADVRLEPARLEEVELPEVEERLRGRLGERPEVDRPPRARGGAEADLLGEDRLPGAGRPGDDRRGALREAAGEDLVEPREAGRETRDVALGLHERA